MAKQNSGELLDLRFSSGIISDGAKFAPCLLLPRQLPVISRQTPLITKELECSL